MTQLAYGVYPGIVVNNEDPEGFGRIQATCPQVLGDHDQMTAWAWPCLTPGSNTTAVPKCGQGVWLIFEGGDPEKPVWLGVWVGADV